MQVPRRPRTPEQIANEQRGLEVQRRLEMKAANMSADEVISALKRHVKNKKVRLHFQVPLLCERLKFSKHKNACK